MNYFELSPRQKLIVDRIDKYILINYLDSTKDIVYALAFLLNKYKINKRILEVRS